MKVRPVFFCPDNFIRSSLPLFVAFQVAGKKSSYYPHLKVDNAFALSGLCLILDLV